MCLAFPGRVLEVSANGALVETAGRTRRASLLMAPDVAVGDWVLVAAGSIVRRIEAREAADLAAELERAMSVTSATRAVPAPNPPGGFR
jgi:hydrogenase expression/formation protein HypC